MFSIVIGIVIIVLSSFAYAGLKGAPWVPTWKRDVARFLELAKIKPGQKMYELGCGDGRLMIAAAKAGAQVTGYEISLLPYLAAKIRCGFSQQRQQSKVRFKDFWQADLSQADVIYFFLTPGPHNRFGSQFAGKLKSGCRVITYVWPIKGWQADQVDKQEKRPDLFLYVIK